MGYDISILKHDLVIPKENVPDAAQCLLNLAESGRLFSWVDTNKIIKLLTTEKRRGWEDPAHFRTLQLAEALCEWRWDTVVWPCGKIVIQHGPEKLGDDEVLFEALAPHLHDSSYVEIRGEDNHLWRWSFVGNQIKTEIGEVQGTKLE